jgi:hypothetical protein
MNDHWEPILREWLPDRLLAGGCPIRTIELIEVARGDARSTIDAMRVPRSCAPSAGPVAGMQRACVVGGRER